MNLRTQIVTFGLAGHALRASEEAGMVRYDIRHRLVQLDS